MADETIPGSRTTEEAPTRPISKADLKKIRAQVTPQKIGHFSDIPVAEVQDWQALGPILERLIENGK